MFVLHPSRSLANSRSNPVNSLYNRVYHASAGEETGIHLGNAGLQNVQQPPGAFAIAAQSAFQALVATEFINSSIAADADIRTRLEASGKILEETSTLLDEIENNNARILVEVDDAREKGISRYRNQFLSSTQRVRKNLANLRRVLKTKNEKFDDLETTYNAHLRLKRPVELWMEREKEHWRQSRIAWGIFLVASVIFAAAITAFLYWGSDWLAESFVLKTCSGYPEEWCTGISPKGPFIVSAIFLLSTIVVWFLRLQIRIYLSERHLALDAAERGAFAETYLALLKGGDVSADQESVVLESLFRPTQDGIIKDDGASDIGIHGIAAKILEGRAK